MVASEQEVYDLDSVLDELGEFGKFQFINYVLICTSIAFNAIFTVSYVFTAGVQEYRCKINECDVNGGNYLEPWLNYTVPFEFGIPNKCERYAFEDQKNTTARISNFQHRETCPKESFNTSHIERCNEFVYMYDERTITNDMNITCPENEWMLTLVGSINNIGQFVGMPLGGFISDRYGRRTVLILSAVASATMGLIRAFSINYTMFVVFEFLDAALGSALYSAALILGIEFVGPSKRVMACSIISSTYAVGEVILGLVAMLTRNWRTLLIVLYVPAYVHILYYWAIPESVRWLLSQGKVNETIDILKKAAKLNKITLSETSILNLQDNHIIINDDQNNVKCDQDTKEKYPLLGAFKSRRLCFRILNCSFCWLTNTFVYYGLSLNSVALSGNKYANFMLVCAIEIPGFIICYFAMSKVNRRVSQSLSLVISGLACLIYIFVDMEGDQSWIGLVLFLIGKLSITISFTILYVYTTEMFPTNLRHSLLSFCSMFGRIGSIIAPQSPLMSQIYQPLPLILFGSCAITSGLLVLLFPETLNAKLPNTVYEAEILDQKHKKELS